VERDFPGALIRGDKPRDYTLRRHSARPLADCNNALGSSTAGAERTRLHYAALQGEGSAVSQTSAER